MAMMVAITTNAEDVAVVNETADNLKGGDVRDIEFTAPEDYSWMWRMTAATADGWEHVPDTQRSTSHRGQVIGVSPII